MMLIGISFRSYGEDGFWTEVGALDEEVHVFNFLISFSEQNPY